MKYKILARHASDLQVTCKKRDIFRAKILYLQEPCKKRASLASHVQVSCKICLHCVQDTLANLARILQNLQENGHFLCKNLASVDLLIVFPWASLNSLKEDLNCLLGNF